MYTIWIGGYALNEGYQFPVPYNPIKKILEIQTKTYDTKNSIGYVGGNTYSSILPTNPTVFNLGNSNIILGVQDDNFENPLTGWISEAIAFPAVPAVTLPAVPAYPAVISLAVRTIMEADQKSYYRTP